MDTQNTFGRNAKLALLLALAQIKSEDLTEKEQSALKELGLQLALRDDAWDFIEKDLINIILGNVTFNRLYQEAKAQLDAVGDIPLQLLPSDEELGQELPNDTDESRGDEPVGKPKKRDTITNASIVVMTTPETAKKLGFIKRIQDFLKSK